MEFMVDPMDGDSRRVNMSLSVPEFMLLRMLVFVGLSGGDQLRTSFDRDVRRISSLLSEDARTTIDEMLDDWDAKRWSDLSGFVLDHARRGWNAEVSDADPDA